jgi:hypothetical protein
MFLFPLYVLARASFEVPVWFDLIFGIGLGIMILPSLFIRSAAAGFAIVALFLLGLPTISSLDFGSLGKPGLLFLFSLWVVLLLVIALDRPERK